MDHAAIAGGIPGTLPLSLRPLRRDQKFNGEVLSFLETAGLEPKRTSVRAPWQNGLAGPHHRPE